MRNQQSDSALPNQICFVQICIFLCQILFCIKCCVCSDFMGYIKSKGCECWDLSDRGSMVGTVALYFHLPDTLALPIDWDSETKVRPGMILFQLISVKTHWIEFMERLDEVQLQT